MNGKNVAIVVAIIVIVVVVAAAALMMSGGPAGPAAGVPTELKVGVILPGTVTDYGWDYAPLVALNKLETMNLPIRITSHKFVELVEPGDAEGAARDLVSVGYNWIWAWGFQYREAILAVASGTSQGVYFLINEGKAADAIPGKVDVIDEYPHKTAYLLGIIGASMSRTKKIGAISGMETLHIVMGEAGFKAGAQAYDPSITFDHIYVGGWADPEGGRVAAESLMAKGVDVIYCQGDGTSLGVIQAVKEARDAGKEVFYIGYPVDQSVLAPGYVLTSNVYDYSEILASMVNDIYSGTYGQGKYSIELGKGMEMAPFYNFDDQIPQRAKDMVAKAREDILSGKLVVPTTL